MFQYYQCELVETDAPHPDNYYYTSVKSSESVIAHGFEFSKLRIVYIHRNKMITPLGKSLDTLHRHRQLWEDDVANGTAIRLQAKCMKDAYEEAKRWAEIRGRVGDL